MISFDQETGAPIEVSVLHFDVHVHYRRGAMKAALMRESASRLCGAFAEPNTKPHLLTYDDIAPYVYDMRAEHPRHTFAASMYLTKNSVFADAKRAWKERLISHVKVYPPHGTTHSDDGVTPEMLLDQNGPVGKFICACADEGIPVKTHGEVVVKDGKQLHPQYREGEWYREVQDPFDDLYRRRGLRHIHAHITTGEAADYIEKNGDPDYRVAEITGHHLFDDWNQLYDGGMLRPDNHWLPASKNEYHTDRVRGLVRKKLPFIHAGSDMAGHDTRNKYAAKAFGGGYTYHCSLELYIQVLEMLERLDFADDFLYGNAKRFHKDLIPDNPSPFRLIRQDWTVTERTRYYDDGEMTPYGYDQDPEKRLVFRWKLVP